MQRTTPLRRGKPLARTGPPARRTRMPKGKAPPKQNRARAKKREAECFGPHGEWIRHLPCSVAFPEVYAPGPDFAERVMAAVQEERVSEASHIKTRGAGGKAAALVPHSTELHRDWHCGRKTFAKKHGDPAPLAARLWEISPHRAAYTETET